MPTAVMYTRPMHKGVDDTKWYAFGRPTLSPPVITPPDPPADGLPYKYKYGSEPWRLLPGEDHIDQMPSGVLIVDIEDYSTSDDLYEALTLIENSSPVQVYVRLKARVYMINKFLQYGPNDYRGWANSKKKVMGLIGAPRVYSGVAPYPVVSESIIRVSATAIQNSEPYNGTPLRDSVLNLTASTGPRPTVLYMSGSNQNTPLFISGITFQGQFQTPFGVLSAASQAYVKVNPGASGPLAYYGFSIWGTPAGTKFQFLHFQGFGWAMNSAPPFEAGLVNSNRCRGEVRRCEFDGRLAPEIDSTQPRSSGGWMRNKELDLAINDSWQHDTRVSGNATNTNTKDTSERYRERNYQCEGIADKNDAYPKDGSASNPAGFNGHNIEGVLGRVISDTCYFNVTRGSHYAIAIPKAGSGTDYILPAPYPMLEVRRFRTDDTLYGGATRVGTNRQPNSTGASPLASYISTNGVLSANDYIKIYKKDDATLKTPVFVKDFNASLHKADDYYVLTSFTS